MVDVPGWRVGSPGEPPSLGLVAASTAASAMKLEGHCKSVGAMLGKLGDAIILSPSSVQSSFRFRRRVIPSTISKPVGCESVYNVFVAILSKK